MFLQGNSGTSSHTERCWEMWVAEGSRAGCASVSSVFGFEAKQSIQANEVKIISSREALYQLLLGTTVSSLLHTALQGAAPCKGTGKGDSWTRCPALCTVLRAKSPFFCLSVPFLLFKAGVLIVCRISGKFITHKVPVGL